jgi:outer membrane protein
MRYVLMTVGLVACPALMVAQQSVPATLSLADAIAIAREHNPAYRQTLNNRGPAAWGVRNAFASLVLPTLTASGGIGYSGPGQQRFLTANFSQSVATLSSSYGLGLNWDLSGTTLSQPGLKRAQDNATEADIAGAATTLVTGVTQQYLTVLQARENAEVARKQLNRNEEFLKLAQARYTVGQATLIDVRQAQVARGQAEVALLQARTAVSVEKLRLFEQLGVMAPLNVDSIQLTDTFPVQAPPWKLEELLTMAEAQNPALQALRARERAANWGVRAAAASYGPSLSVSAQWSGFTQKYSNIDPIIRGQQALGNSEFNNCTQVDNRIRASAGVPQLDCSSFLFGAQQEQALRSQNALYPFSFTQQPFQARLTVSMPIWLNFSQPLQVSQARASHQNLEESVRARGLGVQTEVSQGFLTVATAYRTIAIQDTNRSAAGEQLQLATERYRVGSGTFFELLDAQVAGLRAEYDYVAAVYSYHKAVAGLEAAVGRPLR